MEEFLTLKLILLLALLFLKRIGDVQAGFCLEFDLALVKVLIRPRLCYLNNSALLSSFLCCNPFLHHSLCSRKMLPLRLF